MSGAGEEQQVIAGAPTGANAGGSRRPARRAVLILGMHRSGTSAITRTLHLCGLELPGNLIPGKADDNERGFWEPGAVVANHNILLEQLGSAWDDLAEVSPERLGNAEVAPRRAYILQALYEDLGGASSFVIKDPRICRLMPLWRGLLAEFGAEICCVLQLRNPLEVADSLYRRDGMPLEKGLLLWLRHFLAAERDSREFRRTFVSYESLLDDWRSVVAKVSDDLQLELPPPTSEVAGEVEAFLSRSLRHHTRRQEDLGSDQVPAWVRRAYDWGLRAARAANPDPAELDALREEFDAACKAFLPVIRDESARRRQEEAGRLQERSAREEQVRLRQASDERSAELAGELDRRTQALAASERSHAQAEASLRQEADGLRQEIARVAEDREKLAQEHSAAVQHAAEARRQLQEQAHAEREAAAAELTAARADAARLRSELGGAGSRIREMEGRLANVHRETESLRARLTAREFEVAVLRERLERVKAVAAAQRSPLLDKVRRVRARVTGRPVPPSVAEAVSPGPGAATAEVGRLLAESGLFDATWYLHRNPDVAASGLDPVRHYLQYGAGEFRNPHPLFDVKYYLQSYPDVAAAGGEPLVHFLRHGAAEGRKPNALFDTAWYLEQYPDVAASGLNPLLHYLNHGAAERRDPHPLFHTAYYLDSNPDVSAAGANPLQHYLLNGRYEWRSPNPLFDLAWYAQRYPDVAASGADLLDDYDRAGARAGRNPHPLFDTAYYLATYPDVAASGQNPLAHYMRAGAAKGYDPNRMFDSALYLRLHPDVAASGLNPLVHYAAAGWREGRRPHLLFDGRYYLEHHPDVAKAGLNPLEHYLSGGAAEGRSPNPLFDALYYLERYPDVKAAGVDPLAHYLSRGAAEEREAGPLFDTRYYLEQNPEVVPAGVNPLAHWFDRVVRGQGAPRIWRRPRLLCRSVRGGPDAAAPDAVEALQLKPLVSVLMPTYNSPPRYLRLAIESVLAQSYPNWELCICDDASSDPATLELLRGYAANFPDRVKVDFADRNGGISAATNRAMRLATGEFVAMLDHDDELLPDALLEVVRAVNDEPDVDAVYTDQDYLSPDGEPQEPLLKPDWSPELFRGVMYVGHLLVVRRELAERLGGFDPAYDKSQDFEFMLRVGEATRRIRHVPKVLYHWRRIPGSVAHPTQGKSDIPQLQAAAVNAHLKRLGIPAVAEPNPTHAHRVVLRPAESPRAERAAVAVFVDAENCDPASVSRCVASLRARTRHPDLQIYVVGTGPEVVPQGLADQVRHAPANPLFDTDAGATRDADYLVSVRGDVEVISDDWVEHLLLLAAGRDDVGYVCPLVLRPDGSTVDEAGLVLGLDGSAGPAMAGWLADSDGHAGSLSCNREVSAVPDTCVFASRLAAGRAAPDESAYASRRFRIVHRSTWLGRTTATRNLYTPRVVFRRLAPRTAPEAEQVDTMLYANFWGAAIRDGDPYHNPSFSRKGSGFR